jgi:hypothetical protein
MWVANLIKKRQLRVQNLSKKSYKLFRRTGVRKSGATDRRGGQNFVRWHLIFVRLQQ